MASTNNSNVVIRKRVQISKANRVMFIAVAIASVVVTSSIICSVFLVKKLIFNERVIAQKNSTVNTLTTDITNFSSLKNHVRALNSDEALMSTKAYDDEEAIQSVLDALPTNNNQLALGASLQNKLLANISGLSIESINVDTDNNSNAVVDTSTTTNQVAPNTSTVNLTISVSGNSDVLHQALTRLEQSTRIINVTGLSIQMSGGKEVMTIQGQAYYEPAVQLSLQNKVVKP